MDGGHDEKVMDNSIWKDVGGFLLNLRNCK